MIKGIVLFVAGAVAAVVGFSLWPSLLATTLCVGGGLAMGIGTRLVVDSGAFR